MELYELIAWVLFALIFAFLGMVLGATWKQVEREAHEAGVVKHHDERRGERNPDI